MRIHQNLRSTFAGAAAGAVNGLFGAGGGMILVPMLTRTGVFSEQEIFSSSIVIILPICLVSLIAGSSAGLPWTTAWPYLLGSIPGGLMAVTIGKRIPVIWLHRILGIMILYGGVRYLC